MKLLIITRSFADNSTGRAFALWSLAEQVGWSADVISFSRSEMWAPLRGTKFAAVCRSLELSTPESAVIVERGDYDLIIAVKPFPETLGRAISLGRFHSLPVLADIDDPDLEVRLPLASPLKLAYRVLFRFPEVLRALRMRALLQDVDNIIVSNPVLQRRYGGHIIGHVRADTGAGDQHVKEDVSVVFVGTNRKHKGVTVLRRAVEQVAPLGFTLTVTDSEPVDARPWERWVGSTSLADGLRLVAESDVVVIPSLSGHITSKAQLPAKLIDGMVAGRAIVVSDFEPLRWAVGPGGLLVKPGSVRALAQALRSLSDPSYREKLGSAVRRRAMELFTLEAVASEFEAACRRAINSYAERRRVPRQAPDTWDSSSAKSEDVG